MTIRKLNQQELKLVSGGLTLDPNADYKFRIPLPKWPFPIPHPIDPISFKPIIIDKVTR